ncbi:MAG: FAD-binding protein [Deltaproteobacteria bacterium]|nr:FAD-binding protein [Deltaproteobacteria bacterium]
MRELDVDVLVLGGGAAGSLAAVAAVRAGKRVVLVRRGDGATMLSSGAVDVAEHHVDGALGLTRHARQPGLPVREAAQQVAERSRWHPYARVRGTVPAIPEALTMLAEVARGAELWTRPDGENMVLASTVGTVKRTAMAQSTMVHGDLADAHADEAVLVVHVPHVTLGDGKHVAGGLRWYTAQGGEGRGALRVEDVVVPGITTPDDGLRSPRELARRLQNDEVREALARSLVEAVARAGRVRVVLLPPFFGLGGHAEWVRGLEARVGVPVAELLSAPPSVPGERLQRALDEGVAREGATVLEGVAAPAVLTEGVVSHVDVVPHAGEVPYRVRAPQVVLCTGKYLGGGIRREGHFAEPMLGLPVFIDGTHVTGGWVGGYVGELPEDDQPFMRAGVLTDGTLQPLKEDGRTVAIPGVRAAGNVLAGYDAARMGTGLGVAAVTGMLAGRWAAEG